MKKEILKKYQELILHILKNDFAILGCSCFLPEQTKKLINLIKKIIKIEVQDFQNEKFKIFEN